MPTILRIAVLLAVAVSVAVAGSALGNLTTVADDESEGPSETAEKKDEPRTFTNDDLGKPEGKRTASTTDRPPAEDAGADPLKTLKDAEERRIWAQQQMTDIREEIAALEERIEYWEARKLSVHNPLLSRRAVPEGDRDESIEDPLEGLETVEKLEKIDEIVAELHKQIEAGRERLRKMEEELRNPPPAATAPKPGTEPGQHLLPEPKS
jgi:uncharacterized coiled-coil protein SlyX